VGSEAAIELRDVKKSYGTGAARTPVLRGVSFDIQKGELIALVGQSGSGKSTLLNIIGGLDTADSGGVTVFGNDYAKTPEKVLARVRNQNIGFVFQAFNLLDHLTCLGNVILPSSFRRGSHRHEAEARGLEALTRVGLKEHAHRRPSELSGGQKQRVAIARALFGKPQLLLCDEPTGNLDSETGNEVIQFFKELNEQDGVTLLIVTHERRVSAVARRILAIRDGELVENEDDALEGPNRPGPAE
jgi:putative ABC transport system ATP-binding protein